MLAEGFQEESRQGRRAAGAGTGGGGMLPAPLVSPVSAGSFAS